MRMDGEHLLKLIREIHADIRAAVTLACESGPRETVSSVVEDGEGDTIYAIDRISETMLVDLFESKIASHVPILLVAEGLSGGRVALPRGIKDSEAVWRVIADPIDGTRCLMYQKRSGWILTGVARNHGEETSLADIELAVQTELPLVKQHLSDTLWAIRGKGVGAERLNRFTGERSPFIPRPSAAADLTHGFGSITRFFSGGRDILASIDDEIAYAALGSGREGKAYIFEDQYLSTGGQLYELMVGHDRFLADLRPLLRPVLQQRGLQPGLCCHPYDLCTELIAREAGILVTDETGLPLRALLNLEADVAWIGYANTHLHKLVTPLLRSALECRALLANGAQTEINPTVSNTGS
jgi:fructose-1,6-bisphosphatase/inositol monophosphatase family enzyme